jgi:hypothetical protein
MNSVIQVVPISRYKTVLVVVTLGSSSCFMNELSHVDHSCWRIFQQTEHAVGYFTQDSNPTADCLGIVFQELVEEDTEEDTVKKDALVKECDCNHAVVPTATKRIVKKETMTIAHLVEIAKDNGWLFWAPGLWSKTSIFLRTSSS